MAHPFFLGRVKVVGEFIEVRMLNTVFLVTLRTNTVRQVLSRSPEGVKVRTLTDGALTKRVLELAREYENGSKRKVG